MNTDKNIFRVGFSRVNITPDTPRELCGYGNDDRRVHTRVLDDVYLSCVAVTDEQDTTVMFVTIDLCVIGRVYTGFVRDAITAATGIPADQIMVSVTHTHSSPAIHTIKAEVLAAAEKASVEAMADRKSAEMYFGTADAKGINFVRHYYKHDGSVVTDCHGDIYCKVFAGHVTDADPEMRVLQFKREGGKDVLLVNWQVHPKMASDYTTTELSADVVGIFREYLSKETDSEVVYCQGGAGNINPHSRIFSEEANRKRDYKYHGQLMAETAVEALKNMKKLRTGPVRTTRMEFACKANKEELDKADDAAKVIAFYDAGNSVPDTKIYAETLGIASLYHARSIRNRLTCDPEIMIELAAVSFGEFGWAFAPFEMFDSTARDIRERSPYPYNFVSGYTNGYHSYFPTLACWEYGAYEADTTLASPGMAEASADSLVEMLKNLQK